MLVQDGDPSQNFKPAKIVLDKIDAVQVRKPLRSPDLNPIENAFNFVEQILSNVAVKYSISNESYAMFVERVGNTFLSYPIKHFDNIIKSMQKRISQVIQSKSHLLRY